MPEPTLPDDAVQAAAVAIFQTAAMGETGFSRLARAAVGAAAPLIAEQARRATIEALLSRTDEISGAHLKDDGNRFWVTTLGEIKAWLERRLEDTRDDRG